MKMREADSLAQLVEHNTFNVGVSGSNPERVTKKRLPDVAAFFLCRLPTRITSGWYSRLTSSLTKYVFYNWLINNILYLCVT